MRRLLIVAALSSLAVMTIPGSAMAACDPSIDTADGLQAAPVVFVGRVTAVENNNRTATFEVLSVWKGTHVLEEVTVLGGSADPTEVTPDDRQFQAGVVYLVASSTAANPYNSNLCTATRPWRDIPSIIPPTYQDAVGATKGSSPDPIVVVDEAGSLLDGPIVPIAIGGLIVAGLVVALARITRGPGHTSATDSGRRRKKSRRSRLPSVGRSGEGLSGGLRRSGVSQAERLRGLRGGKKGRKAAKKAKRSKSKRGSLRTDRLAGSPDAGTRETTSV